MLLIACDPKEEADGLSLRAWDERIRLCAFSSLTSCLSQGRQANDPEGVRPTRTFSMVAFRRCLVVTGL